jgi:hypothetical protein
MTATLKKEIDQAHEQDRLAFLRLPMLPPTREFPTDYVLEVPDDALTFNSKFESANLRKAIKVGPAEYNLLLHFDTET